MLLWGSQCAASGRHVLPDHLTWFWPAQPETYSGTPNSLEHTHFPIPLSPNSCKHQPRSSVFHENMLSLATLFYPKPHIISLEASGCTLNDGSWQKVLPADMRTPLPKPAGAVAQQQDPCFCSGNSCLSRSNRLEITQ